MRNVCEFATLIMAQYFESQISNNKITKDFSERKTSNSSSQTGGQAYDKYFQRQTKRYTDLALESYNYQEADCSASQEHRPTTR